MLIQLIFKSTAKVLSMKKKPTLPKIFRSPSLYEKLKLSDLIDDKYKLTWLRDQLVNEDPHLIAIAVEIICLETQGLSHNRLRASMCLKLSSLTLKQSQWEDVLQCILNRLLTGNFSERFKDQLKFIIRTNPQWVRSEVKKGLLSEKEYVRRYSAWLDSKLEAINNKF